MSDILSRLLPAVAEARRPLQIGYLWLFIGWLVSPDLASSTEYDGIAALRATRLFESLPTSLKFAVVTACAFLVGSLANFLFDLLLDRIKITKSMAIPSQRWKLPVRQYDPVSPKLAFSKAKKELILPVLVLLWIFEVKVTQQPFGFTWPDTTIEIDWLDSVLQRLQRFSPILLVIPTLIFFESWWIRRQAHPAPEKHSRDESLTSRLQTATESLTSETEFELIVALQELGDLAQETADAPDTIQSRRDSSTLAVILTSFVSTCQQKTHRTQQAAISALGQGKRQRPPKTRRLSLHGFHFKSLSFQGGDFSFMDFTSCVFDRCNLGASLFKSAVLTDADLRGVELIEANFNSSQMRGANLTNADLFDSIFRSADLSKSILKNADASTGRSVYVQRQWFDRSHYAYFVGPHEKSTKLGPSARRLLNGFRFSKLNGADCTHLTARNTKFINAEARGCDFSKAIMPNADFFGADLQGAIFRGADLRNVNFAGADLSGADLRGAKLAGAQFHRAELTGAKSDSPIAIGSLKELVIHYMNVGRRHEAGKGNDGLDSIG